MNYEKAISDLEKRVAQLEQMVLQITRGNVNTIGKVDDTSNRVTAITPYTETKTAYIGDTEVVFENVPDGIIQVSGIELHHVFWVTKEKDRVTVSFDPLGEVTEVSILIQ